jgi:hypothetical protein
VTATFTGVHTHDALLPDWSAAGRAADVADMTALRARLVDACPRPSDGVGTLRDDAVALDAELARANLDVRLAEAASGHFVTRNPSLWTGEAIFGCVSLMIRDFAPAAERLPALVARLAAVPTFLAEMQRVLVGPVPAWWKQRAVKECAAAEQLFGEGLDLWRVSAGLDGFTTEVTEVTASARRAFVEAGRFLEGLGSDAVDGVTCGKELLGVLLRRGHFCDAAPRELLARAEAAIEEESDALAGMIAALFEGRWTNAQAAMAADRPSVDSYYETFARRWHEVRAAAQAQDVVTWPDWPIRYVPIPAWARAAQPQLYWLFYRSPAPFDPYLTYDYVVAPIDAAMPAEVQQQRLAAWNNSTITLNHVVHHGGIGHHVQNWHAIHRSSSRIGTVAAVDAANRIGMFLGGSMAEGWACYATQLAEELGVLTPLEQVSEQHTRVRLLARAIVDLRLHLGDWSFAACVQYYQSRVGMSAEVATAETTKNSMFPATALMYWLGTQTILDLREQQRAALGDAFCLRDFHDAVLSRGAIPVVLVSRLLSSPAS